MFLMWTCKQMIIIIRIMLYKMYLKRHIFGLHVFTDFDKLRRIICDLKRTFNEVKNKMVTQWKKMILLLSWLCFVYEYMDVYACLDNIVYKPYYYIALKSVKSSEHFYGYCSMASISECIRVWRWPFVPLKLLIIRLLLFVNEFLRYDYGSMLEHTEISIYSIKKLLSLKDIDIRK